MQKPEEGPPLFAKNAKNEAPSSCEVFTSINTSSQISLWRRTGRKGALKKNISARIAGEGARTTLGLLLK